MDEIVRIMEQMTVVLLFGICPILDIHAKLKAIDEQTDDEVVQQRGLRETECSSD